MKACESLNEKGKKRWLVCCSYYRLQWRFRLLPVPRLDIKHGVQSTIIPMGKKGKNIETLILKYLSETFIICLWNMWKQLMQHELGEHWLSGKIVLEHLKIKFETLSFLPWNIVVVWNKKCSATFLIQVWNISNLSSQHLT
jgi:hypothetical protein